MPLDPPPAAPGLTGQASAPRRYHPAEAIENSRSLGSVVEDTSAAEPHPPGAGRRLVPAVVAGASMVCIALVGADRPVLSWDEVTTADVSGRSVAQIWHLVFHVDAVFGAYYLFMHGWTQLLGTSELVLRLPSIIAMAGAVAAAAELGRRLFNPMVGLLAGLFLAVLPNTSRYAAEARPYAFACLFSVLAVLLLITALNRRRPLAWAGYGCAVALLGLSHIVALTTLVAHAVLVAAHRHDRAWGRLVAAWAGTLAAVGVLLLPLAVLGTGQQDTQLAWVDPVTMGSLYRAPGYIVGADPTAWLLIGLAVTAAWRPTYQVVHLVVLGLAPLVVIGLVSVLVTPMWVARYLLVVLAPLAILAAAAVAGRMPARVPAATAVRLLVILALAACTALPDQQRVRGSTPKNGPDYRGIAAVVDRHQLPGDAIVYEVRSRAMRAGMEYYLRRYPSEPRDILRSRPAAEAARLTADEFPDAAAHLAGVHRVWLAVGGHRRDPTTGYPALQPTLRTRYDRIGLWQLNEATLALFRQRPAHHS
jgi:mannosyltransferase